jgi:hypothetical protein
MTLQDLGSIGEFLAAVATVATLVYLAIQLAFTSPFIRDLAEADDARDQVARGLLRSATGLHACREVNDGWR